MNENRRYINEKQVAELTGLALPTLRNDRSSKRRIPYIKVGRSVRYLEADVYAFMEAHRIEAGGTRGAR
jgi:predicted DNA-binding transcriptional regulator AlpA